MKFRKLILILVIGMIILAICPSCLYNSCVKKCFDEKMAEPCEKGEGISGAVVAYLNCKDVRRAECKVICRE